MDFADSTANGAGRDAELQAKFDEVSYPLVVCVSCASRRDSLSPAGDPTAGGERTERDGGKLGAGQDCARGLRLGTTNKAPRQHGQKPRSRAAPHGADRVGRRERQPLGPYRLSRRPPDLHLRRNPRRLPHAPGPHPTQELPPLQGLVTYAVANVSKRRTTRLTSRAAASRSVVGVVVLRRNTKFYSPFYIRTIVDIYPVPFPVQLQSIHRETNEQKRQYNIQRPEKKNKPIRPSPKETPPRPSPLTHSFERQKEEKKIRRDLLEKRQNHSYTEPTRGCVLFPPFPLSSSFLPLDRDSPQSARPPLNSPPIVVAN
mmetsp:Transcript_37508/g.120323  ORF Transcript_37508/g.120323 Transcript_37508/m.120323 type:complete len:315 (+) Transcript_37508:33-977(+)